MAATTTAEEEKALTRLLAEADALKTAKKTKASFGNLLDRRFAQHEVGVSTPATYDSLIRNHIRPALGSVPLTKLHRAPWRSLSGSTATSAGATAAATAACRRSLRSSSS